MFRTLAVTAALAAIASTASAASLPSVSDRFATDMSVVHELLFDHSKINRTVTNLPNGIRTVTESDDPRVAAYLKDHVARMNERLKSGDVFNVASRTLPTIFKNAQSIHTDVQTTPKGVILTQTSSDPTTVAALQAHAGEVSDLAREGMVALQRSMMANAGSAGGHMGSGMMMGRGMMMGMGRGMMGGGNPMTGH